MRSTFVLDDLVDRHFAGSRFRRDPCMSRTVVSTSVSKISSALGDLGPFINLRGLGGGRRADAATAVWGVVLPG